MITAFADGKVVQWKGDIGWKDAPDPTWAPLFEYRIKPEPVLRPWKPEEVPVGCLLKEEGRIYLLTHTKKSDPTALMCAPDGTENGRGWYADTAHLGGLMHSTDFGKTWHPCGVVEDSK